MRKILATSGGFRWDERGVMRVGGLMNEAIRMAGDKDRPRVCMINTASGDDAGYYQRGYAAFAVDRPDVMPSHLQLFTMPNVSDIRAHVLSQDVIFVGGGSVANLLAVWRVHGLDEIMREAWEAGIVLAGVSAGSICWHAGGTTDSFGPDLSAVTNGLGFLPHSNTPHYDSEARRRPLFQSLVANGTLPAGWATDDGVGLYFEGTEFKEAVSERDNAYAWRVEKGTDGRAVETRIEPRRLSD